MLLATFTLTAVLLYAIFSFLQAKKAKKNHEGAAAEEGNARREAEAETPVMGEEWSKSRANNPPAPTPPTA